MTNSILAVRQTAPKRKLPAGSRLTTPQRAQDLSRFLHLISAACKQYGFSLTASVPNADIAVFDEWDRSRNADWPFSAFVKEIGVKVSGLNIQDLMHDQEDARC